MEDTQAFKKLTRSAITFLIGYGVFLLAGALIGNLLFLIIGSLSILSAFLVLIFLPHMRQRVQRRQEMRQAAVAGDTNLAPLAFPQPVPDEHALSLPVTIKLRPTVSMAFVVAGLVTVVWAALLLIAAFFSEGIEAMAAAFTTSTFSTIFVLTFPFLLIFIIGLFAARQRIEITGEGLTIRELTSTDSIHWDKVKLFATSSPKKRTSVIYYELSTSANVIADSVILQRLRPNARLRHLKPDTPFDEYDRQMEALLSLIAAKTDLPLYDLR